jgi:hypothetical protein
MRKRALVLLAALSVFAAAARGAAAAAMEGELVDPSPARGTHKTEAQLMGINLGYIF